MATGHRARTLPRLVGIAAACGALALVPACESSPSSVSASPEDALGGAPPAPEVTVAPGAKTQDVAPRKTVRVDVEHGTLRSVTVAPRGSATTGAATGAADGGDGSGDGAAEGAVAGEQSEDGTRWESRGSLEFGTTYVVRVAVEGEDGETVRERSTFRTVSPDATVRAQVAPLDGETVGVGMPVAVYFTEPVENRKAVERRLDVEASKDVEGSWYWMDDEEVHYRPREYWPADTDVTLTASLDGVNAGGGVWGDQDRTVDFHVGDRVVSRVDVNTHTMTVRRNGEVQRTIPVTTGKKGFLTRGGTKVVLAKERDKRMDASTIGISEDDPEYYDLEVEYAVRVTWSGEFIHSAPWSVGSQGSDNVSHGCVGMATEQAAWYYDISKRGDVVEVTGSSRDMELRNGFGDWNLTWDEWQKGSALG